MSERNETDPKKTNLAKGFLKALGLGFLFDDEDQSQEEKAQYEDQKKGFFAQVNDRLHDEGSWQGAMFMAVSREFEKLGAKFKLFQKESGFGSNSKETPSKNEVVGSNNLSNAKDEAMSNAKDKAMSILRGRKSFEVIDLKDVIGDARSASIGSGTVPQEWYKDDDIKKGLENNNSHRGDVHVFASVPTQHSDLLKSSIETAKGCAEKGETALMPFNIDGNHWVGGAMAKVGDEVCFVHNDPMGTEINKALKEELTAQGIAIIDLQQKQQLGGDTYNCGPFTVDNLTKFAEASQGAKSHDLTKEDLIENLKIGLESGVNSGSEIRKSQSTGGSGR